ncbi:alkaline phosphatase [Piptocephalis cylindrospora]|uniref:Alkaline phosphatase n=1 Tax=Piptocephalis cylindrospora TaxID=1907219 RepID=A0A4P9Y8Y2_9FUNG|nr:alkaline phosphatase [Piptocephalis cylindrospora]|eukprot:RKP14851.1 alkaline phosphatase [Piptocephalis cylindrospora]
MRSELRSLGKKKYRLILVYLIAGLLFVSIIVGSSTWYGQRAQAKRKRNVIFMVSDGFGPASETYARTYFQATQALEHPYGYQLPLDKLLVGSSRTQSSSSLVTDSAAGATAFSCALKSYNGAVGVDPDQKPCGTVLEAAKARGMNTGLVVTSRITHATPAAFSAHVTGRDSESRIAEQQMGEYALGRQVDLLFGGGKCFFLPNETNDGCRLDGRDLWSQYQEEGWATLDTREGFDTLEPTGASLPLMGLFALDHMSYELDRDPKEQPALHEMTHKALEILGAESRQEETGFFLLIEGSRIDMAAHDNDPAAHVHDIAEYQRTVEVVKAFVDSHPETVMISVSDHETGGLTLGMQPGKEYPEYIWYPEVIQRVQNSSWAVGQALSRVDGGVKAKRAALIHSLLPESLGISDATDEEIAFLVDPEQGDIDIEFYLGRMVSRRANVGWTTHGHTGVDVNLYAYGMEAEALRGNHDNTDLGIFVSRFLGLDLPSITDKLNQIILYGWSHG